MDQLLDLLAAHAHMIATDCAIIREHHAAINSMGEDVAAVIDDYKARTGHREFSIFTPSTGKA